MPRSFLKSLYHLIQLLLLESNQLNLQMGYDMLFPQRSHSISFQRLHKLIYGPQKLGKTTLASHLTDGDKPPLFVLTEDGDIALNLYGERVSSWDGFLKLQRTIIENAEEIRRQYSCIVYDLVTELDEECARHICNREGVSYIGDLPHGKGWTLQKQAFRAALKPLMDIMPCVFICHSKDRDIPHSTKKDAKQTIPLLSNSALEFVTGKVDLIAYLGAIKGSKNIRLSMTSTESLLAGSRFPSIAKDYLIDINDIPSCIRKIEGDLNAS